MNFGAIRSAFRALINRKDITDQLAAQFINQTQDRLERWPQANPLKHAPRPGFLEKTVRFNIADDDDGAFTVPTDFLAAKDMWTDYGVIEEVARGAFVATSAGAGCPSVYVKTGRRVEVRPVPAADQDLYLSYFAAQPILALDGDENAWSHSAPEALIYGAAELAADFYEDERLDRFAAKFLGALSDLQDQTLAEAFAGPMRVQPSYSYPD
jgi:hypothetical protein